MYIEQWSCTKGVAIVHLHVCKAAIVCTKKEVDNVTLATKQQKATVVSEKTLAALRHSDMNFCQQHKDMVEIREYKREPPRSC